jgi:hypothetical protein
MNGLLLEWLYSSPDHRLVLLHDREKIEADLLSNPYSPWLFRYGELLKSGQLRVIPKWLCCCQDATEIVDQLL